MGLARHWYQPSFLSLALWPASLVYCALTALRRLLYRLRLLPVTIPPVPIIVVGNITVGGTGKTPLVIWLARYLKEAGRRPGVVTRGYRARAKSWPRFVHANSDADELGDEAVLIARRARCPVVADPKRARGALTLAREAGCDIIVADDGLQHYALARDLEIAVIDGARRHGNGRCLPAGPLREPPARLERVDACVVNGEPREGEWGMRLVPNGYVALGARDGAPSALDRFQGRRVHALAGIGNPARFFATLRALGAEPIEHAFPDHHAFKPADLPSEAGVPLLMTEKDAVKCERFAPPESYYLAVDAEPDRRFVQWLGDRLQSLNTRLKDRHRG